MSAAQAGQAAKKPTAHAAGQHGYTAHVCNAPASGVAIRENDSDSSRERGRLYNGQHWHVYRTGNSEPGIARGWSLGYHYISPGNNINGYFKTAYVCPG